jgi:hypothetical protein
MERQILVGRLEGKGRVGAKHEWDYVTTRQVMYVIR